MRRKLVFLFVLFCGFAIADNFSDWPGRWVKSSLRAPVEKTGAGTQEIIAAPGAGLNLMIRSIHYSMDAACSIYFGHGTDLALTKIAPPVPIEGGSADARYTGDYVIKLVLPANTELDCWTSADPDEGWIWVDYDIVSFAAITGEVY
jgi:hypothetical protein